VDGNGLRRRRAGGVREADVLGLRLFRFRTNRAPFDVGTGLALCGMWSFGPALRTLPLQGWNGEPGTRAAA